MNRRQRRMARTRNRDLYHARTAADLLNSLPAMFGFFPEESVVGLCMSDTTVGFSARVDIPPPHQREDVAAMLVAHLDRYCGTAPSDKVLLLALSQDPARAEEMLHTMRDRLTSPVHSMIWATEDRFWSDQPGCPSGGEPWQRDPAHESVVMAITEGRTVVQDRAAMVAEFDAVQGEERSRLRRLAEEVLLGVDPNDPFGAVPLFRRALAGRELSERQLIELGVMVAEPPWRDECWKLMSRENARLAATTWTRVARTLPFAIGGYAYGLAAFAWWLAGDGARALTAAERGLEVQEPQPMSGVVLSLLDGSVNPDEWARLKPALLGDTPLR